MERRVVRHGEYGFVQASASGVPPGFSLVVLPSLPVERVAYNELFVESASTIERHLVLGAYFPRLDEDLLDGIRKVISPRWAGFRISFVVDNVCDPDGPGLTYSCVVRQSQTGPPPGVAAAAAEWLRWGTLDDIEEVSVTVDGVHYEVAIEAARQHVAATIFESAG